MLQRLAAYAVLVAGVAVAPGCGASDDARAAPTALDRHDLAQVVAARFRAPARLGPLRVTCPAGLERRVDAVTDCTGSAKHRSVGLRVRVTARRGSQVDFDVTPFLSARTVVATIAQSLELQGYQGVTGRCDDELLGRVGEHTECTVTTARGDSHVDVDVTKVDGWLIDFTFES